MIDLRRVTFGCHAVRHLPLDGVTRSELNALLMIHAPDELTLDEAELVICAFLIQSMEGARDTLFQSINPASLNYALAHLWKDKRTNERTEE